MERRALSRHQWACTFEPANRGHVQARRPWTSEDDQALSDAVAAEEAWEGFKKRNDSFIVDKFFGLVRSEVRCDHPECSRVSVTFDPQRAFMLPLPAVTTMMVKVTMVFNDPAKPATRSTWTTTG